MGADIGSKLSTRRALLAAGLGSAAAVATSALVSPAVVSAVDDGQAIHVGDALDVTVTTSLKNTTNDADVLRLTSDGSGTAVSGVSLYGDGVSGSTYDGTGVSGSSEWGEGVSGGSSYGTGVYATSVKGTGVSASSSEGTGVAGISYAGPTGVVGAANGKGTGVYGYSGRMTKGIGRPRLATGVQGAAGGSRASVGVHGWSGLGTGVMGVSVAGRGASFRGAAAQLRLVPAARPHPASGLAGDLFVERTGQLWFCVKGGNPATWKRVQLV